MVKATNGRHDYFLRELQNRPRFLGLDYSTILASSREEKLYVKGQLVAEPDLIFNTTLGLYMFEIKSSPSKACRQKGKQQMRTMYDWVYKFGDPDNTKIGLVYPHSCKSFNLERLIVEWHG